MGLDLYDYEAQRPKPIPEGIRARVTAFEAGPLSDALVFYSFRPMFLQYLAQRYLGFAGETHKARDPALGLAI